MLAHQHISPLTVEHILHPCSAYNAIRSLYFTALTLKELFESTHSPHILDFIKDIGIYKQISLSQTLLIINKSIWH